MDKATKTVLLREHRALRRETDALSDRLDSFLEKIEGAVTEKPEKPKPKPKPRDDDDEDEDEEGDGDDDDE